MKAHASLRLSFAAFALAAIAASCASRAGARLEADSHHSVNAYKRKFNVNSAEARELLSDGLNYCYGFNFKEGVRCFEQAAKIESDCAAAHWGIALALGPHINHTEMSPEDTKKALAALAEANVQLKKNTNKASDVERALIAALEKRYSDAAGAERATLNLQYADAMRDVHARFPNDPDAAELCAEALMNLYPWDLWSSDGAPRPVTHEIIHILDGVLLNYPNHAGANHSYIHTLEASKDPGRALAAADRLRALLPDAAHLVHMPSHIDIRLGHYKDAVEANRRAVDADRRYVKSRGRGGLSALYGSHNYHFFVYASMFEGRRAEALAYARELVDELSSTDTIPMPEVLDGFLATPYHVMERFGMWDEILAEPEPKTKLPATRAFYHFSRALALAAKDKINEARAEREIFINAVDAVPENVQFGNNKARTVLQIGKEYVTGEIEFRAGNRQLGIAHLRTAAALDEALAYDEPWAWMVPAAHALGALLLESGLVAEAREVYESDLKRHPENGWALRGLLECYEKNGDAEKAADTRARFEKAWARADVKITASCYCRK